MLVCPSIFIIYNSSCNKIFSVTGSEDGTVYFLDIEKSGCRAVVNTLQGHAHAVIGISFSYDESMLATSDLEGLVIIWKREDVS